MSETELRKCPFCGGEAKIVKSFYSIWVKCTCCNASTNGGESEEIAAELWNRRNDIVRIAAACAPTAFDKKKVISILTDELRLSEMEKERRATENPSQLRYANGYANGVDFALEIIKKGGIE